MSLPDRREVETAIRYIASHWMKKRKFFSFDFCLLFQKFGSWTKLPLCNVCYFIIFQINTLPFRNVCNLVHLYQLQCPALSFMNQMDSMCFAMTWNLDFWWRPHSTISRRTSRHNSALLTVPNMEASWEQFCPVKDSDFGPFVDFFCHPSPHIFHFCPSVNDGRSSRYRPLSSFCRIDFNSLWHNSTSYRPCHLAFLPASWGFRPRDVPTDNAAALSSPPSYTENRLSRAPKPPLLIPPFKPLFF